jgi:nicotinamidase-related amidase
MAAPARNADLHGNAPDNCPVALLLIDMINDFEFEGAEAWFDRALAAAKAIRALKRRARMAGVPVVYANDNFGKWRSDFRALLGHCLKDGVRGKAIAELLEPQAEDYFVLKPKHSGFHSTTLDVLLDYLQTQTLVLSGVAGNFCVMFTAHDAYMRDFNLLVPRDCVASETELDNRYALEHMAKITKADTGPSARIDFAALKSGGGGGISSRRGRPRHLDQPR